MDIGKRLKYLRGNVSQGALAAKSGVAQTTISAIERGIGSPSLDVMERLCDALGVSLRDLFVEDAELPISSRRLLKLSNHLTEEQREALNNFLASVLLKEEKQQKTTNDSVPTVERIAAHFEGEYGVHDPKLSEHVYKIIRRAQEKKDREDKDG